MSLEIDVYKGIIVPMVTPLTADGYIDKVAAAKLIEFLLNKDSIPFILGTTGEGPSIPSAERQKLVQLLIKAKRHGIPAITGVLGLTIPDTIDEANTFLKMGIDAVVITLPYQYELTEIQIYNYYKVLAEQIDGNIILYNIPKTVKQSIPVNIIEELSYFENIIGIKDSELDEQRLIQSLNLWKNRKDFSHFTGVNALMPLGMKLGSKGMVPSTANLIPATYVELYHACRQGKNSNIEMIIEQTVRWSHLYQKGRTLGDSLAALKYVLSKMELCAPHLMPPLTALNDGEKEKINYTMEKTGLEIAGKI